MILNHTHNPQAGSWVVSANRVGTDFPLQNLPFAAFRRKGIGEKFRGGVAIGDYVIDLGLLAASGALSGPAQAAADACAAETLNAFFEMGPAFWSALRHALFRMLDACADDGSVAACLPALFPMDAVEFALPARIGDYTDFYTSLDHALNAGRLLKPDDPLTLNFKWIPTAYHGRASSVVVSGRPVHRPYGQSMPKGSSAPVFGPCACLDYECELGIFIGQGNAQGSPIPLGRAEDHIFGICLLNDWSARDIQFWEMAPLGPFQGKNFATTISPWVVTMEALVPFRLPWHRPHADPTPLAYLESTGNRRQGGLDIQLEVCLSSQARLDKQSAMLSRTSFKHQYWSVGQMVTHHTAGGCNLQPGDLLGSGTVSGPAPGEAGSLLELASYGANPVDIGGGETRGFLCDGDTVILKGWCESAEHVRIGFGECRGTILPAASMGREP